MKKIKNISLTRTKKKWPHNVQIDIADFEKIEQLLEDHALGKLMEENDSAENLDLKEAKAYYDQ